MEIVTAPYQPAPSLWSRVLIALGVFAPVTVLTLLPIGLGLHRYVVTTDDMSPALERGALVLERDVPLGDLEVGDVITYSPPATSGVEGPVTRRIVAIDGMHVQTKADGRASVDPWPVPIGGATLQRVELSVPWVGFLYVGLLHPGVGTVLSASFAGLVLVTLAGWFLAASARRRRVEEVP